MFCSVKIPALGNAAQDLGYSYAYNSLNVDTSERLLCPALNRHQGEKTSLTTLMQLSAWREVLK